jgi:hypothetical protein
MGSRAETQRKGTIHNTVLNVGMYTAEMVVVEDPY